MNELFEKPVNKLYFSYLIPTIVGMLSNSVYNLVDIYFISKGAGSMGLGALNISMPIFTIFSAVGLLFGVGGATIMSIAEGSKDEGLRNKAFTLSLFMMTCIGLLFTIFGWIFIEPLAYAFGSSEELLPYVLDYLKPTVLVSIPFTVMYSSSILIRADHNPKLAMIALMSGNISNMILDYVFVMIFNWGIFGAAFATALSPCITLMIDSFHFILHKNNVKFVRHFYDKDLLKRMFSNGLGSGVMEISAGAIIMIFNIVILTISNELYLAAYALITNIAYVGKGLLNGFAQAAQPIISSNYGAGKMDRVKEGLRVCVKYSFIFTIVVYIIFLMIPSVIVTPFAGNDPKLIEIACRGMRIYFISLMFTAVNTMLMYYFQSIERGKISTIFAVLKGFVFILIGLALLVPMLWIDGVWLSVTFAEVMTFIFAYKIMKKQLNTI